ncbi:MAG TPA: ABC transporter permease [Bauldia sp.]|nr:ABC transporter permease [Bauldia sp.]
MNEPMRSAAAGIPAAPPTAGGRPEWLATAAIVAIAAAVILVAVFVTPKFLTVDNIRAILRNAAIVGIVAVGMTPVTLSGNFVSLGITQSAMLAMVTFVALLGAGWGQVPAVVVVLILLIAVGVLQGVIIAAGLNPVITTLAAGAIIFGVVSELSGGGIVRAGDNAVSWGAATIAGVPLEVLIFLVFTALVTLVMQRTVAGRETILIGANRATAEISGISFTRVTILAFAIFSIGLALAGILNGAAFGQATAVSFPGLTVDVIAAVLVGGTAIQGGRGSPIRSAGGAILIAVISNMMVLNDFSTGGRLAVQGGVVVAIVVLLDLLWKRGTRRT